MLEGVEQTALETIRHPYTKIEFVMHDLEVTRITATRYLGELVRTGHLKLHKISKTNFYMNEDLYQLLLKGMG